MQCWRRSLGHPGRSSNLKKLKNAEKVKSHKTVRWSALPLCEDKWVCDGEKGSGPKGVKDLNLVSFEGLGLNFSINNGI